MLDLPPEEPQALVVDDMPATRALLKDMLYQIGFGRVIEASGGREALAKLKSEGADLIVCDYMMKDMSGLDLLNQLRNHAYLVDIPFIVVSSNGDAPVIETALDLGAADYLVKPVSFQLLKRKISDVIMRRMNR